MQRLTANFADGGNDLQNRKAYLRSKITRLDEAGVTELLDGRSNTKTVSHVELQAEVDALDDVQRRGRPVSAHQPLEDDDGSQGHFQTRSTSSTNYTNNRCINHQPPSSHGKTVGRCCTVQRCKRQSRPLPALLQTDGAYFVPTVDGVKDVLSKHQQPVGTGRTTEQESYWNESALRYSVRDLRLD